MRKIAIDIDDTLHDFCGQARDMRGKYAEEMGDKSLLRGAYCAWPEWRSPADVIDLEHWLAIIDRCHSDAAILGQEPLPGAQHGLDLIADEYEILYISTRKEGATEATAEWLFDEWDFPDGELICTSESKIPYIRDCRYIVDDRARTLVQFVMDPDWVLINSDTPRIGFGLLREYNRNLTDIPGIQLAPSWPLLLTTMREAGVLSA